MHLQSCRISAPWCRTERYMRRGWRCLPKVRGGCRADLSLRTLTASQDALLLDTLFQAALVQGPHMPAATQSEDIHGNP